MAKSSKKSSTKSSSGNSGSRKATSSNRGSGQSGVATSRQTSGTSPEVETLPLMDLFEHALKDMLWAEKALTKAIPKMIKNAQDDSLQSALEDHLLVTENQVSKLEKVFESINKTARAKKCSGMEGIITEGEEIMEEFDDELIDSAIIAAGRKVEHYEISSYMSMIELAKAMGMSNEAQILQEILAEEQEADKILQNIGRTLSKEMMQTS